ncbi:MAG: hypothetical protein GY786_21590 [Proteobacteria bacterium]|nr:hypothetical protein [Pseudomonadota bacterium]
MSSMLLGFLIFGMFGWGDRPYDALEVSQINFIKNERSQDAYLYDSHSIDQVNSVGGRDFEQINGFFRFGFGGLIYQMDSKADKDDSQFEQYGGYLGWNLEFTLGEYLSFGSLVGLGTTTTTIDLKDEDAREETHYFGLTSPFVRLYIPLGDSFSLSASYSDYHLSDYSESGDGKGDGYESPNAWDQKYGLELAWKY